MNLKPPADRETPLWIEFLLFAVMLAAIAIAGARI